MKETSASIVFDKKFHKHDIVYYKPYEGTNRLGYMHGGMYMKGSQIKTRDIMWRLLNKEECIIINHSPRLFLYYPTLHTLCVYPSLTNYQATHFSVNGNDFSYMVGLQSVATSFDGKVYARKNLPDRATGEFIVKNDKVIVLRDDSIKTYVKTSSEFLAEWELYNSVAINGSVIHFKNVNYGDYFYSTHDGFYTIDGKVSSCHTAIFHQPNDDGTTTDITVQIGIMHTWANANYFVQSYSKWDILFANNGGHHSFQSVDVLERRDNYQHQRAIFYVGGVAIMYTRFQEESGFATLARFNVTNGRFVRMPSPSGVVVDMLPNSFRVKTLAIPMNSSEHPVASDTNEVVGDSYRGDNTSFHGRIGLCATSRDSHNTSPKFLAVVADSKGRVAIAIFNDSSLSSGFGFYPNDYEKNHCYTLSKNVLQTYTPTIFSSTTGFYGHGASIDSQYLLPNANYQTTIKVKQEDGSYKTVNLPTTQFIVTLPEDSKGKCIWLKRQTNAQEWYLDDNNYLRKHGTNTTDTQSGFIVPCKVTNVNGLKIWMDWATTDVADITSSRVWNIGFGKKMSKGKVRFYCLYHRDNGYSKVVDEGFIWDWEGTKGFDYLYFMGINGSPVFQKIEGIKGTNRCPICYRNDVHYTMDD